MTNQEPVVNEKTWDKWVAKGQREDKTAQRKLAWVVSILLLVGFPAAWILTVAPR